MKAKPRPSKASRRAQQVAAEFNEVSRAYSNEDWERFLQKLKHVLCPEPSTTNSLTPNHSEIQDALPFYVYEEQLGSDVQQVYPLVWEHLRTCRDCQDVYNLLQTEQSPADQERPTPPKSAKPGRVKPVSPPVAWRKMEQTAKGIYAFTFSPEYIQTLWTPENNMSTLRGAHSESDILLLDDEIRHKRDRIHLTAWLAPSGGRGNTDQLRVEITPTRFVRLVEATLQWNGKAQSAVRAKSALLFQNLESPRTNNSRTQGSPLGDFALEVKISD